MLTSGRRTLRPCKLQCCFDVVIAWEYPGIHGGADECCSGAAVELGEGFSGAVFDQQVKRGVFGQRFGDGIEGA
jgi:hypothetical protein